MKESSVPSRTMTGNGRKVPTDSMSKAKAARFQSLSSSEFSRKNYRREFLIEGVLVNQQFCILGGPKKSLKTSLQVEMAVALATATPFLGQFRVLTAKRVAIFSGETSPGDLQDLARRVCVAHWTTLEKVQGVEWIHNLPRLWDETDVKQLRAFLKAKKIEVTLVAHVEPPLTIPTAACREAEPAQTTRTDTRRSAAIEQSSPTQPPVAAFDST
jgi:hypothetical protein